MVKKTNILFTAENIKAYLAGEFSKVERAKFEQLIDQNPFYRDALEGYKSQSKGLDIIDQLKHNNKYRSKKISGAYYIAGVVFILISVWVWYNLSYNQTREKGETLIKKSSKKIEKEFIENREKSNALTKTMKVQKADSKELIEKHKLYVSKNNKNELNVKRKLNYVSIPKRPITSIEVKQKKALVTESIPLVSIYGFIVVDYSKIKDGNQIKKQTLNLKSVPASKENKSSNLETHQLKTEQIDYIEFFSKSQELFLANNFKKALEGYNQILEQYPTDVNAHFYSGLCYYNLNQNKKAINSFNIVQTHYYNTFSEEAEWYKANALLDMNDIKDARLLLKSIIQKDGFYAEQANNLLNSTN